MKWKRGYQSRNVEDRRGRGGGGFGGRGGAPMKLGLGGIILLAILSFVFEQDFFSLLNAGVDTGGGSVTAPGSSTQGSAGPGDEMSQFVGFVLDENQQVWQQVTPRLGVPYREATLVLFTGSTPTACGYGKAATGPFYCPGDESVYIDLAFFDTLARRFGAPGDFAQAYVIAHEVGHHVQNVLGIERSMRDLQRRNPSRANDLSVRMELQADCLAGVWASVSARKDLLDPGDVEEGMAAAAAVGDDTLQKNSQGWVNPESFTHGTSQQRVAWFRRGLQSGDPDQCDTFGASSL